MKERKKSEDPRLTFLNNISSLVTSVSDLDRLLELIIESATEVMGARASSLLLLDKKKEKLYFQAATGDKKDDVKKFEVSLGKGIAGYVAKTGKPLLVEDVEKGSVWDKKISESIGFDTKSIACVPMKIGEEVIGVVEIIDREDGKPIRSGDMDILMAFANLAASAIMKATEYKKMVAENVGLKSQLDERYQIVGESSEIKKVIADAIKVANSKSTVLIEGESGTGKELIARLIHRSGPRRDKAFVIVNCGALPETLLEAELFGHERGSFTGALYKKIGLFETADGGTIFLDEIGEMSQTMQVKLLRVLQESTFNRIGSSVPITVDVRVISATNKDLSKRTKEGKFREDLFYRINVIQLKMPALRERREDIALLAEYFLLEYSGDRGLKKMEISSEAMKVMLSYDWPGNVRELENAIERAVVMGDGNPIMVSDLPIGKTDGGFDGGVEVGMTLRDAQDLFKKEFLKKTLAYTHGNRKKAAEIMEIQRTYLSRLISEFGLRF
ncbi:sigma-54-dependent Fis family transcriptional regulator [bacterium]|nr:sigma-54-dependent Fis family transcriptional regulator [bacterium]